MALRLPALAAAIERAMARHGAEQVEFSEGERIERWYRAHVMPVVCGRGGADIELFLLTLHDLTPLRRVEEVRADFVANASHELRTPLAALSGFIDTLMGPARDDPTAREEFLAIMQAQARRMARLIDDLLSLSRIELSEHIEPDATAELQPLLHHVVDAMQTLARERSVELRVSAPRKALVVPGDRDELVRLFENLIENALKYAASGKRVAATSAVRSRSRCRGRSPPAGQVIEMRPASAVLRHHDFRSGLHVLGHEGLRTLDAVGCSGRRPRSSRRSPAP
jgi:two-component system, OmpR family, phosphate regulon sensor histidine kinase PhoR